MDDSLIVKVSDSQLRSRLNSSLLKYGSRMAKRDTANKNK